MILFECLCLFGLYDGESSGICERIQISDCWEEGGIVMRPD